MLVKLLLQKLVSDIVIVIRADDYSVLVLTLTEYFIHFAIEDETVVDVKQL